MEQTNPFYSLLCQLPNLKTVQLERQEATAIDIAEGTAILCYDLQTGQRAIGHLLEHYITTLSKTSPPDPALIRDSAVLTRTLGDIVTALEILREEANYSAREDRFAEGLRLMRELDEPQGEEV